MISLYRHHMACDKLYRELFMFRIDFNINTDVTWVESTRYQQATPRRIRILDGVMWSKSPKALC